MNSSKNDNSLNNETQKLYDINELNDKYNLKLNLDFKKKKSNIFHGKKYTIIGMLNKLFHYYSHESNNNNIKQNIDSQTSNYVHYSKSNNSLLNTGQIKIKKEQKNNLYIGHYDLNNNNNTYEALKNTSGDDTNTFITKLNMNNINRTLEKKEKEKELDVTRFIKERCSLSDVNSRSRL